VWLGMSVHFKFKSSRSFDQINIVGNVIKVYDLKVAIVEKKKLTKGLDFDLILTNADTKLGAVKALRRALSLNSLITHFFRKSGEFTNTSPCLFKYYFQCTKMTIF
jgi:hypothetical protein